VGSFAVRYRNFVLFLLLAAVWGSAFMAIKAGLELGFPPVLFAAVRYDIAGVLMLGYAAVVARSLPRGRDEWLTVLVGAVFLIAAYHAFLFVGEGFDAVTSAAAAVIVSLSPVLTTAFARVMLPGERLTPIGIAGMVLGLVGVAILSRPDPGDLFAGSLGFLLVFAAGLSFAFGSVLTRRIDAAVPIETMEAWAMLGGALLMHGVSAVSGESFAPMTAALTGPDALAAWSALLYLSLAASALGFLIYFDLLDRLGPIEINLVSYVAPVFAALAGFVFLDEGVTPYTVAGFVVILVGFVLLKREALAAELPKLRAALTGE
jgi:probable blue pigment (indigoidine) exporter